VKHITRVMNISQIHEMVGLEPPLHPLISVMRNCNNKMDLNMVDKYFTTDLYMISMKGKQGGSIQYGRGHYDFQEGTLVFLAPDQIISVDTTGHGSVPEYMGDETGWTLFFHTDLFRHMGLGETIHEYHYFGYDVNEALHLSAREKETIRTIIEKIEEEYSQNIDAHSQTLIVSNLELLLNYCKRFYSRQFLTRTAQSRDLVRRFERLLDEYFTSEHHISQGVPTVKYCAGELGFSPDYLGDLLRQETGKSTIDHIHQALIERAKTRLLASSDSVSEVAYHLGFEYPQYFSKMFKAKTGMTPGAYRKGIGHK